jgi:hypothetical protein
MAVKKTDTKRSPWDARITKAEKYQQMWHEHGANVYKRYEDKREGADSGSAIKKVNLFYANVNTLKESLFNSLPKADVQKIHKGNYNDNVARVACLITARVLDYEVECAPDFSEAINLCVLDRLVPGLGQLWSSFDVEEGADGNPVPGSEKIMVEHLHWTDFLWEPAKRWSKVGWVARKLHLTKEDFTEKFGEELMAKVGAPSTSRDDYNMQDIDKDKICVYEIWNKKTKEVIFRFKGLEEDLMRMDDPYQLANFFPCPRPLIANVTTNNFLPVTDYHLAQDQYNQLDVLYARISLIIDALRVAGIYASDQGSSIGRMLQEGENKLVPVDNWAMLKEQGGIAGLIEWYPVQNVIQVLEKLQQQFEAIKGLLAEVSGMSDIVRGDTNQYETAKAQTIKAQFASVRLSGYQRDVAVFVRDTMRIMADLAFGLYSDQKLMTIVGDIDEPDQQYVAAAAQILRSDQRMKYKIDIQADSLTQADWALEKGAKQELVQVLGAMIGQTMQMVEQVPEMAMLAVQMIKFSVSGYKGSRDLEGWIDQQLDQMQKAAQAKAQNPQPKPPSEAEQKAQGEMQKLQMEAQIAQKQAAQDMQMEQQKMQFEQQRQQAELAHQAQMNAMELQMKQMELQLKQKEAMMKVTATAVSNQQNIEATQAKNELAAKQQAAKPKNGAD